MMSHFQLNSCLWIHGITVLVSKMSEGHYAVLCQTVIIHTCADPAELTLAVAVPCFTSSK